MMSAITNDDAGCPGCAMCGAPVPPEFTEFDDCDFGGLDTIPAVYMPPLSEANIAARASPVEDSLATIAFTIMLLFSMYVVYMDVFVWRTLQP